MGREEPEPLHELNLGAAKTRIPGFVNIDIHERAEISLDLGTERLPFPDNSVRTVVSHHTLEHVPDYLFALSEIHRVLVHDGELLLSLPYATLTEHHQINPYHHHNFTERSFDFFDPLLLKGSAAEDGDTAFRQVVVRFTYMGAFGVLPRPLRVWSRRHLLNVVRQFDVALVAIKDPDRPVDVGPARARELEERVVELKRRREPYPHDGGGGGGDDDPPGTVSAAAERASAAPVRPTPPRRERMPLRALRYRADTVLRRWEVRHD